MVNKLVGYFLSLLGIAGLIITNVPKIREAINLEIPFGDETLMVVSVILVVFGVVLIAKYGDIRNKKRYIPVKEKGKVVEYRLEN